MAPKLKDHYDLPFIKRLADILSAPGFDGAAYLAALPEGYEELTFLDRQDAIADMLEQGLKGDYPAHLKLFEGILGPPLKGETGMFTEGWWLWPIGRYVERHALEKPAETLSFLHAFTQRHTGEYAVRPLLMADPRGTMETMLKWAKDESVHVRRLASEGLRVSLPWAQRTEAALKEPQLLARILGRLKDDASKLVQKSVGNNLNDLYRHQPRVAQALVDNWEKEDLSAAARWVIRHGQRGLRKAEEKQARKDG